ncbi:prolyl oligopeptidase family serine peptidase [Inhella crocodyli]|nr:prolyl oligopeptidase family serine peptidase [Inhella crocodyli]
MRRHLLSALLLSLPAWAVAQSPQRAPAPLVSPRVLAPAEPLQEQRHGIAIDDRYRWMERSDRAADLQAWLQAATAEGMAQLAARPERAAWVERLQQALQPGVRYAGLVEVGGRQFVRRSLVGEPTPKLVVRERQGQAWTERVLFDPAAEEGGALNNFSVAPDGRTVALLASSKGSEVGDVRFLDVATGREVGQRFGPVFGDFRANWLDAQHAVISRLGDPAKGNPLETMVAHVTRLGADPKPVFGFGLPGTAATQPPEFPIVMAEPDSRWTFAVGANARADRRMLVALTADVIAGRPQWQPVADYEQRVTGAALQGDRLYLLSTLKQSGGEVFVATLRGKGQLGPKQRVAVGDRTPIVDIATSRDGLYLVGTRDGAAHLRFMPGGRGPVREVALPFEAALESLSPSDGQRSLVASLSGWTQARGFYRLQGDRLSPIGVASEVWAEAAQLQVSRHLARSADGTEVPMVVIRHRTAQGAQPALLEAYGAYGIPTVEPIYNPSLLAWASRHTLAYCGVRGGNERGRAWHEGGREANKPKAHADFIACGQTLVKLGLTTPVQLAAMGTSAGGLLAPVAALQRPDLFRAAVPRVAVLNPTRLEAMANGPNQYAEMGDPRTEAGFRALASQDALLILQAQLRAKPAYLPPALLVTLGLNDQRVSPWMPAKFAATAQALVGARSPVLVRADGAQGHGVGSAVGGVVQEWADTFTFLNTVLGTEP